MAAPGLDERGRFARGVREVLGGWAALQLAVAQGFGGPQSPEKAAWLAVALQDFFSHNADLEEEEVEEFLAEVMDNEFDTAVEDGSLRQVSHQLVTLFAWASRGEGPGAEPPPGAGPALGAEPTPAPPPPAGGAPAPPPPAEEEAMECGPSPPPEGWSLVQRRRR